MRKQTLLLAILFNLFGEVYADSFFHSDSTYLKGRITGSSGKTGMIHVANEITGTDTLYLVELDSAGYFSICLSLPYPMRNYIELNEKRIPFYLTPGDTLKLEVVWDETENTYENIAYFGSLARINDELLQSQNIKLKEIPFPENDFANSSCLAYHDQVRKAYQDYISQLTQRKKDILPETWKLLLDEAIVYQASRLLHFDQMVVMNGQPEHFTEPSEDRYYDFMKQINWNDPALLSLLSSDYFFTIMDYCPLLMKKWKLQQAPDLFLKTLEKAGYSIPLDAKSASAIDWRKLERQYSDSSLYGIAQQMVYRETVLRQEMSLKPGIIWDILNVRMLKQTLNYTTDRKEALKQRDFLLDGVTNPLLLSLGNQVVDDFFPKIPSEPKALVLPEGPAQEILSRLTQPYYGKLILMDIWATWCGPCVSGIESMQPVREKLADKNIAFLFVSSEQNSPVELYNRIMQPVQGHKYRLKEDEYNYLCQALNITVIPRYILIDSAGQIINPNFRIADPEKICRILEDLLQ